MRKSYCFFAFIFGISLSNAQTNVSGTISIDSTWTRSGSPYIVTGNVSVSSGKTLTVDSGVVVRFRENTGLYVNGALNARHARFTSDKDSIGGNPQKGDWVYIQVGDGYSYSATATFDTCVIKYGGTPSPGADAANVFVFSGSASFTACDISFSKNYGVMFAGGALSASVTLTNSNIFSCDWPISYRGPGSLVFNGSNNLAGNAHNGIYVASTTISNTVVLDTASVPYVFLGTYTIGSGGKLEIASPNILKFGNGVSLTVDGALVANAGVGEKIYFTSYTNDNLGGDTNADGAATSPASSYWGGISFRNSSVDSLCLLRRCKVTFAGYSNLGGVTMTNASPTVDSCEMADNYYGAMMQDVSNPVFSNNVIGSSQVVPIAMSFAANPVFLNNSFSFSDNQYDAIGLLGGNLAANSILSIRSVTSIPNVTYLMLEDVSVPQGVTLTIQKGIVIKSRLENYRPRIIIQGKLVAAGTPDSLITFTSARDDNYGNPGDTNKDGTQTSPQVGDWSGIVFEGTSDTSSVISYCRLKYGSLPGTYYNTRYIDGGEITTVNAAPTITNCEIKDVNYGIYAFQASNPKIWNNDIINTQYTPIAMSVSANPSFIGNTFTNTKWTALGIIGENLGLSGSLKQRTVAGISNITYLLLEDLTINSGTNVTVDPGVVIKSNQAGIFVNGGFRAKGTIAGGQIIFTSMKDDNVGQPQDTNGDGNGTSPQQGDWKAIRFQATSDDVFCLLDSCVVKFGGSNYDVALGAVTFVDASGTISNTLVSDSYNYGVRCDGGSNPFVSSVELRNCRLDPLAMSLKSNPTFTNITFTSNGTKGIRILEGTLSSNATLSKRDVAGITNIAYIVEVLTISPNAVLTIDPGVVVKFPNIYYCNNGGITINGALIADGTATQKIIFTSLKDDSNGGDTNNDGNNSTPTRGDWWSIEFRSSGSDSLNSLKNCEIRYGGSGACSYQAIKEQGAVRVFDAHVRIDSCIVQQSANSGLGIYGSASPIVSNVQIYNILYTPVTMSLFANPTFTNISALNVGIMALGIVPETYSVSAPVPKRDFAGYYNITYYLYAGGYGERPVVNSGTTVTIPSGVVFKSDPGFQGILVNGGLVVQGTSVQKVVFTNLKDDSYGNPGDTNGDGSSTPPEFSRINKGWIEMSDVSDDSVSSINDAMFRYREYGIDLLQASPRVSNCTFDKTDWGVRLNGVSQPTLDSCTFNNLTYAPIRTSVVSYPRSSEGNSITGTTYRAIGILEETLVQDVTMPRRSFGGVNNIPYLFGDYTIGTSAVLTISPGVVMKFFSDKRMIIRKGLIAEGGSTRDSLIVFTDLRDDFYGGDTNADSTATAPDPLSYAGIHWLGIDFEDESLDPLCRLRHAVVRFAGTPWTNQYGGIITNNASPTITYSLISKNRFGIIANGASNPVINYCDIYDNSEFGIQNVNESFVIDARWNWWGNNSGPMHSSNVGGTGNKISDGINYTPFLTNGATNPILGDVSLNGAVQAFDASLILKYVVNPTGPDSLNSIQRQVADVSGNGAIMAYDASLILQYVVGLIPRFPAGATPSDPDATVLQRVLALHKTSSAAFKVGSGSGRHGERLIIPLEVDRMTGVVSLQAALNFDARVMKVVDVEGGGVTIGKTFVWAKDNQSGELRIALASSSLLTSGGTLARITFEIADDVRGTASSPITVTQVVANESDMTSSAQSAVIEIVGKPTSYQLFENYPNPFNPSTTIQYQVPDDNSLVHIAVYNTLGQLVKILVDERKDAGTHVVQWNGTDERGVLVGSGVYYYRMRAGNFVQSKKLMLLK